MQLIHRDLAVLNDVALEMHGCADENQLLGALPGLFQRAIPCELVLVLFVCPGSDGSGGRCERWWESRPFITDEELVRIQGVIHEHPFMRRMMATGKLDPTTISDYYSDRQFRNTRLFDEAYRHANVHRLLGASAADPGRILGLNLARGARARDFSDRDRGMLGLLRRHFEAARRTVRQRAACREQGLAEHPRPHSPLTPREGEVATWLARGKTNPEIATILGMRPRTVEKHVEHIFDKLEVGNRTRATLALRLAPER